MTQEKKQEAALIAAISKSCKTPAEVTAKLKELFAGTLETMLEAEMDVHLGYEKHSPQGNGSGNSRNGHGHKTISTEWGEAEITVPRDRNSTFEPRAVEKRVFLAMRLLSLNDGRVDYPTPKIPSFENRAPNVS
jgi:putative transposase